LQTRVGKGGIARLKRGHNLKNRVSESGGDVSSTGSKKNPARRGAAKKTRIEERKGGGAGWESACHLSTKKEMARFLAHHLTPSKGGKYVSVWFLGRGALWAEETGRESGPGRRDRERPLAHRGRMASDAGQRGRGGASLGAIQETEKESRCRSDEGDTFSNRLLQGTSPSPREKGKEKKEGGIRSEGDKIGNGKKRERGTRMQRTFAVT